MFHKPIHCLIVLLLIFAVELSVRGQVSHGVVVEKKNLVSKQLSNASLAPAELSEHGQDSDIVKKVDVSIKLRDDGTVQTANYNKSNLLSDNSSPPDQSSMVSYSVDSADGKPSDVTNPQKDKTETDTTNPITTLNPSTNTDNDSTDTSTEIEETTLPDTTASEMTSPDNTSQTSTKTTSSSSTSTTEVVSPNTANSSSISTTESSSVTAVTVTATSSEESTTHGKTEEPKIEPTKSKDQGMPSEIVALIMAIVFAVVVILVYVGLILWRRYLEFRYGNRELLVNDLEFDTNDLRHFEL